MKKVDIRKVYVCEIMKQNEVREIPHIFNNICTWDYDENISHGLFVRVLGGYKHILTDTIYSKPSRKTGNKHVINPKNIELFVRKERALASHLINKYKSFDMDTDVIKLLEDRINSDKISEEEDFSL